jgi:hypothetical protein
MENSTITKVDQKRKVITLGKDEFVDMAKNWENYQIEQDEKEKFHFKSPFEAIDILPIVNQETQEKELKMYRKLILDGHEYDANDIKVSDKYLPITLSEIFKYMLDSEYFNEFADMIDSVKLFRNNGGMKIDLKQRHMNKPVLDIELTKTLDNRKSYDFIPEDFNIRKSEYGPYHPVLNIENSFNKMKAFGVNMGMLRLVCMNGMTSFKESFSLKKKHFKYNMDAIKNLINNGLSQIKSLDDAKFNDAFDLEISKDDKDLYVIKLNDWLKDKKESKTYQNDKAVQHTVNHMYDVYKHVTQLPELENVWDITNFNSFFETPSFRTGRFSTTVNQTASQLRKLWNDVKPEMKSVNY